MHVFTIAMHATSHQKPAVSVKYIPMHSFSLSVDASEAVVKPVFHRFSVAHAFEKPNDMRALSLMDNCAKVRASAC